MSPLVSLIYGVPLIVKYSTFVEHKFCVSYQNITLVHVLNWVHLKCVYWCIKEVEYIINF